VPVKVTVPDLVGLTEAAAKTALDTIGLSSVSTSIVDARPVGTVIAQSPSAGAQVNKGSVVTLALSAGQDAWTSTTDTIIVEKLGAQEKYRLNVKGHTVDLS
jgi:beta-lactam-binding protein with PASTA domain